jgi:TM2 domain-containing membrane protein YozV
MKKILLLLVLLSSNILPQINQHHSILELKIQSSDFRIKNPTLNIQFVQENISTDKKNPGLAILYSLLLPGMGELYAGDYQNGKYFTIADGLIWGVLAGFSIYGNWQEENYRAFAKTNANVELTGKTSDFFANIGSYLSIEDYNRAQDLNRDFDKVYNTTTHYWKWESNNHRKEFRNMWSSSEQAYNNVRFAVGALLLNRLISVINAVRLVTAYNKKLSENEQLNISFGIQHWFTLPSAYTLNIRTQF